MSKVVAIMSMSLDGYVADRKDGVAEVFDWYFTSGDVEFHTGGSDPMTFKVSGPSAEHLRGLWSELGAVLTGRGTFDVAHGWGGNHAWGPAFVLTHHIPAGWPRPNSTVHFVTDGIESAVNQAKAAAAGKSVGVHGADTIQQCLNAGLLDEIHVDIAARSPTPHPFSPGLLGNKPFLNLLIIGATGGTGQQLVTQALERGHRVTALVRKEPAAAARPELITVLGNVLDASSLDRAVRGQDAVLSALGHKQFFRPTRILSEGTRNLIGSMRRHGVHRFVCETALGISDSWWQMGLYYTLFVRPVIVPLYFRDKIRQETVIRASELDWTIVRPGALTNGPKRGHYRHGPRVGHWLWTVRISRADVAAFMLDQLTDGRYVRTVVGVAD